MDGPSVLGRQQHRARVSFSYHSRGRIEHAEKAAAAGSALLLRVVAE
jgi:hypothetical protein